MSKSKHLVIIHGRDKKPVCEEMLKLTIQSLVAGLGRVDETAAKKFNEGAIQLSFIYYGDINNGLLLKRHPELKKIMHEINGNWYVKDDYYDEDMERLIQRLTSSLNAENYRELLQGQEQIALRDDLARTISPFVSLFDMSYRAIRRLLPDLGAYLTSRVVGSEIRERLQKPLANALQKDDVMLISHSMGCMVSYDVLWKFSRMSEYKHLWDKKLNIWLTIGNPLGEPSVSKGLYDSDEPEDGKYPTNIKNWININAVDDYIAHDLTMEDDFRPMLHERLVNHIIDEPPIYNFWKDHMGRCNPHNLFGYLNHPDVAKHVAKWMNG